MLGPIVWQFMPTKAFDAEDFEGFLALLPKKEGGRTLRHVLDVDHHDGTAGEIGVGRDEVARAIHARTVVPGACDEHERAFGPVR